MDPLSKPSAQQLTETAVSLADAGDTAGARSHLERAVQTDPAYEPAYALLSRQCLGERDFPAAAESASVGLRRFPKNADCSQARAEARLALGDFAGAEADAGAALALGGGSVPAYCCKADALLAQGRTQGAIECLLQARQLDPEDTGIMPVLGAAYQAHGDLEQARKLYVEAGEADPFNPLVYVSLAGLQLRRDDPTTGLMYVDLALALGGEAPTTRCLRGTLLLKLRRLDEAKDDFATAVEGNPTDCHSWVGIAEIEAVESPGSEKARQQAVKHARIALELSPKGNVARRARRVLRRLGAS